MIRPNKQEWDRIRHIAAEAVRLQVAPAFTPTSEQDADFGRYWSAEIWDAISTLAVEQRKDKRKRTGDEDEHKRRNPVDTAEDAEEPEPDEPTDPNEVPDEDENEDSLGDENETKPSKKRGLFHGKYFSYPD